MRLPELNLGNLKIPKPIIQGGMAVRISTSRLAAAVANEGGVGIIAGTGMALEELRSEIRQARALTDGVIGVNVLYAVTEFADLVKTALQEGIDLVFSGAGFSRDMFAWGQEYNTPIVPIISSAKFGKLAQKMGAAAVVVEGSEAGGHLGTDRSVAEILPEVRDTVSIPVIAAGGIVDREDIERMLALGANAVQMGTRFAASIESNASQALKEWYVRSTSADMVLVDSPVGLPGRSLANPFTEAVSGDKRVPIAHCSQCLKRCSHKFCIMDALNHAVEGGSFEKALVFSGQKIDKIKEILSVKDIFQELCGTQP